MGYISPLAAEGMDNYNYMQRPTSPLKSVTPVAILSEAEFRTLYEQWKRGQDVSAFMSPVSGGGWQVIEGIINSYAKRAQEELDKLESVEPSVVTAAALKARFTREMAQHILREANMAANAEMPVSTGSL